MKIEKVQNFRKYRFQIFKNSKISKISKISKKSIVDFFDFHFWYFWYFRAFRDFRNFRNFEIFWNLKSIFSKILYFFRFSFFEIRDSLTSYRDTFSNPEGEIQRSSIYIQTGRFKNVFENWNRSGRNVFWEEKLDNVG